METLWLASPARFALAAAMVLFTVGCQPKPAPPASTVGQPLDRKGDEIMVAGRLFHTGAPVVLWTDPGGYDAYRTERRFAPWDAASFAATTRQAKDVDSPARYGVREQVLTGAELEQVRGGGWPLDLLQRKVDQFVLHYDVAGTSRTCFKVLHDLRGLSVQFMLDLDGTIYQTCDLKERAFHATKSNPRSVGIEIANMGAYANVVPLKEWYAKDATGRTAITIPRRFGDGGIRDKSVVLRPARNELVAGPIHGRTYRQYDLTPQQYDSLTKLVAALGTVLPRITVDYPKDSGGQLITTELTDEQWRNYTGVLGHYHVQRNKQDPGPAFQWDRVINGARRLMSPEALKRNDAMRGQAVAHHEGRGTGAKPTPGGAEPARPGPATQPAARPSTLPAAAAAADALADRLRPLLHRLDPAGAVVAARIIELPSGRELYADRADEAVIPASNMKLPVSAAALDRFGPDHELKTVLAVDGDDLWLIGTGDPATGDPEIAKKKGEKPTAVLDRWADALKARGVTAIKGHLYYDDAAFDDVRVHPTWSRSFLTDWYAAPVAGLNFNDNCVDVTVRPAGGGGEALATTATAASTAAADRPAAFEVMPPTSAGVEVVNRTVTNGEGDAEIDRAPDANVFTLRGGVRSEKKLESKPVIDPGAFFADALRTNLASHGITIAGDTRRADRPLGGPAGPRPDQVVAVHATPLRDVLWRINKNSQNLFAEAVCKYLGRAYAIDRGEADARGSWEAGGKAVKAFLANQGVADAARYVIVDGSGLARGNRVTARGQTDLLLAMSRHRHAAAFRDSLAVAGVDGTIGKRSADIAGRVLAKTGYIGGVRALSGYVRTRGDQWLGFSIIYNGIPGSVKPYEALQDDACRLMVEWPDVDRAVLRSATQSATRPAPRPCPSRARSPA